MNERRQSIKDEMKAENVINEAGILLTNKN